MSLNNEKNCCAISEDKIIIAVCEKTAGLRSGSVLKVLVSVKIFQIQDMFNENRFLDTFRGHNIRPIKRKNATKPPRRVEQHPKRIDHLGYLG